MLEHLTITVPGVPDDLRTPGTFVHVSDTWRDGLPAPVAPAGNPTYADFVATPLTGTAPLAVQFTDLSTMPRGAWSWNFGDSGTSTDQNPIHVYNTPGVYTVILTATGPDGSDSKTRPAYINVDVPPSSGSWLITSTTGARTGIPGGAWAALALPAGFAPGGSYSATPLAADGAQKLFIWGYDNVSAAWKSVATTNGGTDWTSIVFPVDSAGVNDVGGVYVLEGYFVAVLSSLRTEPRFAHALDPTGSWTINMAFDMVPGGINSTFEGINSLCAHSDGYVYGAKSTETNYVRAFAGVYRAASPADTSWTQVRAEEVIGGFPTNTWLLASAGGKLMLMNGFGDMTYSANGTTWSAIDHTFIWYDSAELVADFAGGNIDGVGYFLAIVGGGDTAYIASATDLVFGGHIVGITAPGFTKFTRAAFGGGKFLLAGDAGVVVQVEINPSTGVPTFTIIDAGFGASDLLNGVAYLGN